MNHSITIIRIVIFFIIIFNKLSLYGQNDLKISYKCKNETSRHIKTEISLETIKGKKIKIFSDTICKYNFYMKKFIKKRGMYNLYVFIKNDNNIDDSIKYCFDLNGNELMTDITINIHFTNDKEKSHGHLYLNKYYNTPKSIKINFDSIYLKEKLNYYPIFSLKNNSTDTLYGEHLPGYFWGTLSYMKNGSKIFTSIGILDYNFVDSDPLFPDSTKYATVGSFSINTRLTPHAYRFELLLSKKWQGIGIGLYKEKKDFIWWAGTKSYYLLKYDFKIEK